jgi:tetratricopeptide (TPR) repeat protein
MEGSTGRPHRLTRLLPLLAVLAGTFWLCFFKVCDPDVFWQLKVGEVILDTGRMVRTNIFAATFPDHPFFNTEWLFQVVLALAYRAGGWGGVAALKTLLVLLLAGTLYATCLGRRDAPLPAAFLTLAAVAAIRFRLTERPQLVSLLFFALLILVVDRHRRTGSRQLWALPALFALWGNCHAELMLGLLYLAGTATGELVAALRDRSRSLATPRRHLGVAALGLVATGLNPEGYRVLAHPFTHFGIGAIIEVKEFMVSRPALVPLFWAFLAASVLAVALPRARHDWAEILPAAGLALLGARYLREVPFFILAAAPLLQGALPAHVRPQGRRAAAAWAGGGALLLAGAFAWELRFDKLMAYGWGWGVSERYFPVAAMDVMERAGFPPTIYNHYEDGGYLIYRLYPRMGVFQDGRSSAYPDEWLARMHARHTGEEWEENLERFGVNTALVGLPEAGFLFPRDRWALVFWDDRYCIFVRRTEATRELLARWEYRLFRPEAAAQVRLVGNPAVLPALLAEIRRNEGERSYPNGWLFSEKGQALARLGQYPEAAVALRRAAAMLPEVPIVWLNLGLVELRLPGRDAEGRAALEQAVRLDPSGEMRRWLAGREQGTPGPR